MAFWSVLFPQSAPMPLPARPSLMLFFLLAGAFLLALVPHVVQFPLWLSVVVVGAMAVRSFIEYYRLPLPSITFCGILAILLLGGILVQFKTVLGRDAGTALTAGLLAIKFYELRRPRDVALIIFSCFFVVMSSLLYSQALELFIYCLIMMWVLTALLLRVHTGDLPQDNLLRMLRMAGVVFLQALPFTLCLFFFFPRYAGKLSVNLDDARIGLTDTIAPGSIAKLAQNDSEAMYVQFTTQAVPNPTTMYWRALVLWDYNNGVWTPGALASIPVREKPTAGPGSINFQQEITIKPHNQKWLFALDDPVSIASNEAESTSWSQQLDGNILQLTTGNLDHLARYTVTSSSVIADQDISPGEKEAASHLPETARDHIDPAVIALADKLHEGLGEGQEQDYIRAVLRYFRHNGFRYDTSPGEQGPNWLPTFLFKTKIGFCEHFASAFAVLMRQEKIPTRLIAGYWGAEYNPYADHYTVRQSNAHAWDEVWIPARSRTGKGEKEKGHWLRVDPTALLARSEEGASATNTTQPDETLSIQIAHRQITFSEAYLPSWVKNTMQELKLRREEVEANWDNLVLSYDPEAQTRLAQALGFGDKAPLGLLLSTLLAGIICLLIFYRWITHKPPLSPVEASYAEFCRSMARRGIPRALWEGPLAYTERVAEAFPDDKLAIQRVGSIVSQSRYGPNFDPATTHDLQALLHLLTASPSASSSS